MWDEGYIEPLWLLTSRHGDSNRYLQGPNVDLYLIDGHYSRGESWLHLNLVV